MTVIDGQPVAAYTRVQVLYLKYVSRCIFFSSGLPVEQDQRLKEMNCAGAGRPLLGGEEPEGDQRSTLTTSTGSLTRSGKKK